MRFIARFKDRIDDSRTGYALELRIQEYQPALRESLGKKSGLPLRAAIHERLAEAQSFARMAQECGISEDMGRAFEIVRRYFATLREDKG